MASRITIHNHSNHTGPFGGVRSRITTPLSRASSFQDAFVFHEGWFAVPLVSLKPASGLARGDWCVCVLHKPVIKCANEF